MFRMNGKGGRFRMNGFMDSRLRGNDGRDGRLSVYALPLTGFPAALPTVAKVC